MTHVTPAVWSEKLLQHPSYGTDETYQAAAEWMKPCRVVADWGGASGYLRRFLLPTTDYRRIDGTLQDKSSPQVLADLTTYREPSEGIVLRHVLDQCENWQAVLDNAIAAFQLRLCVITFTPEAPVTRIAKIKSGWPIWHFNHDDLRARMGRFLVSEELRLTSHRERVYYLARPAQEAA